MKCQLPGVPSQAPRGRSDANVEDISELLSLEEDNVMSVFKARFEEGVIYTRAASVMISINPFHPSLFEEDGIYNMASQELYAKGPGKDDLEKLSRVSSVIFFIALALY